jgi:hypothetical protein
METIRAPICPNHGLPLDRLAVYGCHRFWTCRTCSRELWREMEARWNLHTKAGMHLHPKEQTNGDQRI